MDSCAKPRAPSGPGGAGRGRAGCRYRTLCSAGITFLGQGENKTAAHPFSEDSRAWPEPELPPEDGGGCRRWD